jgi:GTP cyclohydrolase I
VNHPKIRDCVHEILDAVGEDPKRDGLFDTPRRVSRMYGEILNGYSTDVKELLRQFEYGKADGGMVIVRAIPFYSLCEHHMIPFFGEASVGYLPQGGLVIGLSKFARLVDVFARRLQVQERMTDQIVDSLVDHVTPDCMAVVRARHLCMEIRGVEKPGTLTVTSAVRGKFKESFNVRQEFLELIK